MSDSIPTFKTKPAMAEGGRFSNTTVRFQCPKCGRWNHHGYGDGHRVAHCRCWPNGYYIETRHLEARRLNRIAERSRRTAWGIQGEHQ